MSTSSRISARDGESLAIRRWQPAGEARASILIVHGLGEHGGRYERTAGILAERGFDCWAADLRGFGASGGRRAYVERIDVWLDDLADELGLLIVMGRPVVLLAHSMGGLVACRYAETDRPQPDLLVLSAPALAGNIPAWQRALAPVMGRLLPNLAVKNAFDGSILSRDPAVGRDYLADPLNVHSTTARLGAAVLALEGPTLAELNRIRVPTLVIHGGADHLVPTRSSEAFNGRPGIERRVFDGLAHESFNEPEGPEVVGQVADWISAHLPTAVSR
ncbi:MAG TPA: lysophospholipase [Candidatus Limnocylindrales bacterium]